MKKTTIQKFSADCCQLAKSDNKKSGVNGSNGCYKKDSTLHDVRSYFTFIQSSLISIFLLIMSVDAKL